MAKKNLVLILTVLSIFGLLVFETALQSGDGLHGVWAIKDCRIITQAGPPIEKGTLVIRDGLIEVVGTSVAVPPDAELIDGAGLTVYPGLTDALNQSLLKMPEEKFDPAKVYTGEFTDKDRGITPGVAAFDHFEISTTTLEKYHKYGITTVQVMPHRGILTGRSSVFSLSGSDKNTGLILKDAALGIGFSPSSFLVYPNSLMGVIASIRQEFSDASHFETHDSRWSQEMRGIPRPAYNPKADLLSAYAQGKKPVIFFCRSQHDIRRALSLAAEFDLDFFICDTGNEAFRAIPELKSAEARVLCGLTFKPPPTSVYAQKGKSVQEQAEKELYAKNPARLAEAGIPFAFVSLGTDDPKSFIEGVQKAVDNGLAREKALEALTVTPARFLGLAKALGTIEPGKIANLVIVEGDILAKETKVKGVFADGKRFEVKEVKVKEGEKPSVNVSGRWEISIEGQGLKVTVDFLQEEAILSGKMTTPFGIFDFSGGTVTGKEIFFEMTISVGGQELELYFSAVVEDDRMEGTVVQGTEGSATFTGKRIPG